MLDDFVITVHELCFLASLVRGADTNRERSLMVHVRHCPVSKVQDGILPAPNVTQNSQKYDMHFLTLESILLK